MSSTILSLLAEERVHLVLEDTAHHLTGQDLLKIAQIAEQGHAAVHISYGSWQVLVGVPARSHELVAEVLRTMGYECNILTGEFNDLSTFVLKGETI